MFVAYDALSEAMKHVSRPEFCYFHKWRKGDLVIWDNRCTLHKAERYDMSRCRRVFRRTTVAGDGPVLGPYSEAVLNAGH
jgi:alpha-ketoglutarate-dependent taurine dioxygenase